VPSAVDEIFAWIGDVHVRFKMVVLKTFSLAPYPVPWVDTRTLAGLKSWTAVWPETVEAAAAMHTVARLCRKTELLILRELLPMIPLLDHPHSGGKAHRLTRVD